MTNKKKCFVVVGCLMMAAIVVNSKEGNAINKAIAKEENSNSLLGLSKKLSLKATRSPYVDDFDIKGEGDVSELKDFAGVENLYLGNVIRPGDSVAYQTEDKLTYASGWTGERIKRPFNAKRFDTYYFSRYVNLPIKILERIELAAGQSMTFQSSYISQTSASYSTTITESYELTLKQSAKLEFSVGASIPLDCIKVSGAAAMEGQISTSESLSRTASQTWNKSVSFSEQITTTWPLHNNAPGERRVYQLNYRQKFRLYFTTEYNYYFSVRSYNTGLWNRDTHYEYTQRTDRFGSVQTRFFLIPVDLPTLGFTEYHNASDGTELPTTLIENNVLYL